MIRHITEGENMTKGTGRFLMLPRGMGQNNNRENVPVSLVDIRTPWLLHVRKPKNRGNAGAGMKARKFLESVDQFFPGGAK